MHGRAREVDVVAAHAHQLVLVGHRVGGERHADHLAAEEERAHLLPLGRHHLHPPDFLGERRHGDQVVLLDVVLGLARQIANQVGLLARLDVQRLHLLERRLPVVAEAHLARRLLHLGLAPGELALGDREQLLGRVGDHLGAELGASASRPIGVPTIGSSSPGRMPSDALAQQLAIRVERRAALLVGSLGPPREQRVVALVVVEPAAERGRQLSRSPARGRPRASSP